MINFNTIAKAAFLMSVTSLLASCSTLSGMNPFSNDSGPDASQGDIPDESDRLTILSLGDTLKLGGTLTPADVKLPAPYVNVDWTQPGGNQYHAMQHTAASGSLGKLWSKDVGKGSGSKGRVVAQPVIAAGVIYTVDAANRVTALSENGGKTLWEYDVKVASKGITRTGGVKFTDRLKRPFNLFGEKAGSDLEAVGGGLAFEGGRLYVASGFGVMISLDATSGQEVWRTRTRTPLHSAPAVSNGRVFAVSDDNEIFAFDTNDGQVLWTYQGIIENARMMTSPAPAVVDDVVLAPFASGELVALRAQNGGVLWQDALSSSGKVTPLSSLNDIAAGPVVADGYVFATAQSGVISAFDLRTGQRIWSQPAGGLGFPWIAGEFLYIVTTDGNLVCMSRADGNPIWMTQLEVYEKPKKKKGKIAWTGPILAGDKLFVAGSNGAGKTINPYNGTVLDTFKIGDPIFVPPLIANETIYVMTDKAKLVALR